MTARWVVSISEHRALDVRWQPISLKVKNQTAPDSRSSDGVVLSHRMLRVMEAAREHGGDEAVDAWYTELGRRFHHDRDRDFAAADALAACGLDPSLAEAADDESWDGVIDIAMTAGLDLVGNDVGTPIIAWSSDDGRRHGIFGPVITRVPSLDDGLRLWDAMVTVTEIPGFWELKRTRTERPDCGPRP